MEMHELVDENGENTGKLLTHIEARNLDNIPKNCYLHIVGVVIVNSKNEVLLQKRSRFKRVKPNVWGICGGKIDYGETPIDAGVRETLEEIGVKLYKDELKILIKQPIKEEKIYCTTYYIKQDVDIDKCVLQKEEVEEVRYFKIDELETIDNEGIEWLDNLKQFIK